VEKNMKIDAVDLFCGAGGLSYGLKKAGINVRVGVDLDPKCSFPYTENMNGAAFILEDVSKVSAQKLVRYYHQNSFKLLAGCAPCQPFSTLRNGSDRKKSDKWPLLGEFSRLVKEIRPDLVTMENVPNLKKQSIFVEFVETLQKEGYFVTSGVVDAANYGLPQRRNRLVLLASLHEPIYMLSPEEIGVKKKTVKDAIYSLPPIEAGGVSKNDSLHRSRSLSEINLARIKASRPGGTWEDWPENLKLKCHKKDSGSTFTSVYGRLEWDKPAGTITTQAYSFGTGRFGHPEQNRGLSLRELAILQSFPEDYKFSPKDTEPDFTSIGRLIGNAVPVDLAYAVGLSIQQHVQSLTSSKA
jgi:DNA (cytosine-5)-methyltransferase 1